MGDKRSILYFTIEPELRNQFKAAAALRGKSLKEWALEAMQEKMARELPVAFRLPLRVQEERGSSLEAALRLMEALHPSIAAGVHGDMDAATDLRAMRDERVSSLDD